MNKNYRILWSASRREWVVADELASAGGKGKSRGVVSKLLCAALVAAGLLTGATDPALADTCPTSNTNVSTTVSGQCVVTGTNTVTVTSAGTLKNAGASVSEISVEASGTGVQITNSGSILSTSKSSAINVNAGASGTKITNNSGATIGAAQSGNNQSLTALLYAGTIDAQLTNIGTIKATAAISFLTSTIARGVHAGSNLSSVLNNSGTIQAKATSHGAVTGTTQRATAYGIQIGGTISATTGQLTNSGTISATAINNGKIASSSSSFSKALSVMAYGISSGTLAGILTNSGTVSNISATATNTGNNDSSKISVTAYGVKFTGLTTGTLTNEGTISAKSTNSGIAHKTISVSATGAKSDALTNSGTSSKITATADNSGKANKGNIGVAAYGISTGNTLPRTLTNQGAITATVTNSGQATTGNINVSAYGISVGVLSTTGTLTNDGTISAKATNSGNVVRANRKMHVFAYGVTISSASNALSGTLSNTGTISATATNTGTGGNSIVVSATGVKITSMSATGKLDNSGTISATSSSGVKFGYSLKVLGSAAGSTINNKAGGLLKGNISVVGSATVNNAGTIEIPDAVTTAGIATALNNQAGGVLQIGGGSILTTPDVQNAGTVSILDGKSATITGNLTQLAGGKIKIGALSTASFGKLTVSGTADLTASGAFDVNVAGANTLAAGNTLTGVLTAGTLTVGGGGITVTDNSSLFDFTGAVNGNAVDLSIVAAASSSSSTVLSSVQTTSFTPGAGAAKVFDDLIAGGSSGDMSNVITALGKLATGQQVSDAVAQTLPLMTGDMQQTGINISHSISSALAGQLAGVAGMASGDGFFGSGKLWIKPFGGFTRQHDRNGASGFDANSFGLMAGIDKDISDATSMAFAFAWGRSLVDSNNGFNSADVNAFNLAVSGIYHLDADTFLRVSANSGINLNDGRRSIAFGGLSRLATSSYNSWMAHGGVEAGHRFAVRQNLSLTPSLHADYSMIRDNSYTESGAGALNLHVNSHTTDELLLGGDVKLTYIISDTASFNASAGSAYDALQEQASSTSSFAGTPTTAFVTQGINPPRWLGRGNVSLNIRTAGGMDIVMAYNVEGRRDFFNHTGSINLVKTF